MRPYIFDTLGEVPYTLAPKKRVLITDNRGGLVILFGPEHTDAMAKDGLSKEDAKQFIYENIKIPREWLIKSGTWYIAKEQQPEWVRKAVTDGEPMIPQFNSPEEITISVVGGQGKQSLLGISYVNPKPVIIQDRIT